MKTTTKIILAAVAVLVLSVSAVAVKMIWFPSVDDAWFQLGPQKLKQVPAGKVIVRPTHFARSEETGMIILPKKMVGRNVPFKDLIATAYGESAGRVVLPVDAPKNNFDFLVTVLSGRDEHLRAEIQKRTGFKAHPETRDADVLALKIMDPALPGLKESGADEKPGQNMKGGRLYFTHQKLSMILEPLEHIIKTPVVDKTALTGYYNFSVAWNPKIQKGELTQDDVEAILKEWGLRLDPDVAPMTMLVVEKAK